MSFPASEAFREDSRVTPTLMRVYKFCYDHLDRWQRRECKLGWVEHELNQKAKRGDERTDRSNVARALRWLVAAGYLIEHNPQPGKPRWFTLAHSVRHPEQQVAA